MESGEIDIYLTIVSISIVLLLLIVFIVSFLFIYQRRKVKHILEIESVKEKFTQELLRTELEIKERTMNQISQEIHDNVGQILSLAVLHLSSIDFQKEDNHQDKAERTLKLIEKAITDLRHLSKSLDSDYVHASGITSLIKNELDLLEKSGVFKTTFQIHGIERMLSKKQELVIYRIVQEAFNNIVKHSGANLIHVLIIFEPDKFLLTIEDNGVGFELLDQDSSKRILGSGLRNMQKRAQLIHLQLNIHSTPHQGTKISLKFVEPEK